MWPFKKKRNWLFVLESGKNNIAGCKLHIIKNSVTVKAKNYEEAEKLLWADRYNIPKHYGYPGDYCIISEVKIL